MTETAGGKLWPICAAFSKKEFSGFAAQASKGTVNTERLLNMELGGGKMSEVETFGKEFPLGTETKLGTST